MVQCACTDCVCCDTRVFVLDDKDSREQLRCPSCNRTLRIHRLGSFGEADWWTCADPDLLADAGRSQLTERKARLFACACGRLVWDRLADSRLRAAVEVAERAIDGIATGEEYNRARRWAEEAASHQATPWAPSVAVAAAFEQGPRPDRVIQAVLGRRRFRKAEDAARVAAVFRDIVANPFRPPPAPLSADVLAWNDGIVRRLAQTIYDERAFDRLPILGDALEEAGCTDDALLAHCHSPGQHVRGCWALDLARGLT